jgi:hypothetical protein
MFSSHVIGIIMVLFAEAYAAFIPFTTLEAVILDLDMVFTYCSDSHPCINFFPHGGFTHSMFGAAIISIIGFFVGVLFSVSGNIDDLASIARSSNDFLMFVLSSNGNLFVFSDGKAVFFAGRNQAKRLSYPPYHKKRRGLVPMSVIWRGPNSSSFR